jgi:hypothetical protein
MAVTTTPSQPELNLTGQPLQTSTDPAKAKSYKPALVLGFLLMAFLIIEGFIPLRTAVQIGADEGFELAKATLCLNGHHLYTEVWNDQPPLHTFLITQVLKHISPSILCARLLTVGFSLLLLSSIFVITYRINGLFVAALTTGLVIASPGFLELSSSCMLEIPALATAVAALCFLLLGRESKWFLREIIAGVIFGLAIQMKLVPVIYVSLMVLVVFLHRRQEVRPITRTLMSLAMLGASIAVAYVGVDLLIERGAFLLNFQQTWASHFSPAKSFEYGSASQHPFEWSLLLKNWDITVPAIVGLAVLLPQVGPLSFSVLPLAWLGLTFVVFGIHKPWWPYYYLHTAIPLCWCAGIGTAFLYHRLKTAECCCSPWLYSAYARPRGWEHEFIYK